METNTLTAIETVSGRTQTGLCAQFYSEEIFRLRDLQVPCPHPHNGNSELPTDSKLLEYKMAIFLDQLF